MSDTTRTAPEGAETLAPQTHETSPGAAAKPKVI